MNYLIVRVYYMSTISAFLCQQLYPCSMNSYEVQFINNDDQNQKLPTKRKIKSFPHTISSLTPYTFYNVTIWYKNKHLFGKEVRTLEGGEFYCIFNISNPLSVCI